MVTGSRLGKPSLELASGFSTWSFDFPEPKTRDVLQQIMDEHKLPESMQKEGG